MTLLRYFLFFLLPLIAKPSMAQDISFTFANPVVTAVGPFGSYEVDVMVSTTADFKLGAGQLYFNYNTAAFGSSIFSNGRVTITTTGNILGQSSGPFPIYSSIVTNDNTSSRLSYSWQQALSSGCFSNNISGTATALIHLRLDYISGGSAQAPMLCFESVSPFDDQTFTGCGPDGSCTFSDCGGTPGSQITNDSYDCSGSALPVELLDFSLFQNTPEQVELQWETANEDNSSHFEVERSVDAQYWSTIGQQPAAGFSWNLKQYHFSDQTIGQLTAETLYYRLRIVDRDGSFTYSMIRTIDLQFEKGKETRLSVYPVPASEGIYVEIEQKQSLRKLRLEVYDLQGRELMRRELDAFDGPYYLEWGAQLSAGVYWLRVRTREGVWSRKIVVGE